MKKKVTDWLLAIVLVVFALTFAVSFTLNFKPLYYFDIDNLNIPEISGLPREQIVENYDELISYNSVFRSTPLEFKNLAMSPEGRIHFEEVKDIFNMLQLCCIVSAILLAVGVAIKRRRREFDFLKFGAILSVILPVVLGAMVAVNWQWFFVTFHKIAFSNDYWIFDPVKDQVITILPDAFFMHCAIMVLGVIVLISVLSYVLWKMLVKRSGYLPLERIIAPENTAVKEREIIDVLRRSVSIIDPRLVAHGDRVAFMINETLSHAGKLSDYNMRNLCILSVFHDIGAGKVNEVDELVKFKTKDIMKHSVYGYVFLKYLSPLGDFAESILYHHMNYKDLCAIQCKYKDYAALINLMDRIDIYIKQNDKIDYDKLRELSGSLFSGDFVEMFIKADMERHIVERCVDGSYVKNIPGLISSVKFTQEEVLEYMKMIVYIIDFISSCTVTHTINTTSISVELARRFGYTGRDIDVISYAAFLHDIGKISIPQEILEAPGKLTMQEMKKMKTHVVVTDDILRNVVSDEVRLIASRHHEKLDGSGYPNGLKAKDLTEPQRIVAVADILSALISLRSYKEAFSKQKAVGIIEEMRDSGQLDKKVCNEVISGYDAIIEAVLENQKPVVEIYEKIASEYENLIGAYGLTD